MQLLNQLAQAIYDKKAANIVALDVRGLSSMTDYLLVAEGSVDRHVKALSEEVLKTLDQLNIKPSHVEGTQESDWIVIDCWDVVVHLFVPQLRGRYQIERLWQEAKVVNLELDLSRAV